MMPPTKEKTAKPQMQKKTKRWELRVFRLCGGKPRQSLIWQLFRGLSRPKQMPNLAVKRDCAKARSPLPQRWAYDKLTRSIKNDTEINNVFSGSCDILE